jgi:cell division septal protein FtsQ
MCRRKSPESVYKLSTIKMKKQQNTCKQIKNKIVCTVIIVIVIITTIIIIFPLTKFEVIIKR